MPTSPKPKIHVNYTDPTADVTLVSSNGVQFQLHSYILRGSSKVFRDMLDSNLASHPSHPISLPEPSTLLFFLLELLHHRQPLGIDIPLELPHLARLIDKYDIPCGRNVLGMYAVTIRKPWSREAFALAAQLDLPAVAAAVVEGFEEGLDAPWAWCGRVLGELPWAYFGGLCQAYAEGNENKWRGEWSWAGVKFLGPLGD